MEESGESREVHGDPGAYRVCTEYITQLQTQPLGYQVCMDLLTNNNKYDDSIKCMCWKVIRNHVKDNYQLATPSDRKLMRTFLVLYIEAGDSQCRFDSPETLHIASLIYLMVFIHDYQEHWRDFFNVICDSLHRGLRTVDNTVRIVHKITMWMGEDAELGTTEDDINRKCAIKLTFKNHDICRIFEFICNVIKMYTELRAPSLKSLQELTKWVDPGVFTYPAILETISGQLDDKGQWDSAIDCVIQLVKVRQSPMSTHALLEKLLNVVEPRLAAATSSSNKLFLRKIGVLHDEIEESILTACMDAMKVDEFEHAQIMQQEMELRFQHVQMYLNSPDYEISKSVHPFMTKYLQFIQNCGELTPLQREHLNVMFTICLQRLKMNLFFDIQLTLYSDNFRDYRSKMTTIMKAILNIDQTYLIQEISFQLPKISNWRVEKILFRDLELPIFLIEVLCEIVAQWPAPHLLNNAQRACVLDMPVIFQKLIETRLNRHGHPAVVTQYFITLFKGKHYFIEDPIYLERVLSAFLIHIGPIDQYAIVRETCIDLYSQLMLSLHSGLLIRELDMLKMIRSFLAEDTLKPEPMLNLYHAAAYIIQMGHFDNIQRKIYHLELMFPVLNDFRVAVSEWHLTTEDNKSVLAKSICFTLTAITRTTLIYSDQAALEATGCAENYVKAFDIVQHCLSVVSCQRNIHVAIVILLNRLVLLLQDKLLPYIPTVILALFSSTDYRSCIEEAVELMVLMIDTYQSRLLSFFKDEFQRIGHSIYLCYEIAVHRAMGNERKKNCLLFLERIYLSFVEALIRNNLYDGIFVEGDHLALLNVMFMIVAKCLPSLTVSDEKMEEYEHYLKSNVEFIDFNAQRVAIEVKQLFHHRMYSNPYFL